MTANGDSGAATRVGAPAADVSRHGLESARRVLKLEAEGIAALDASLGDRFVAAPESPLAVISRNYPRFD